MSAQTWSQPWYYEHDEVHMTIDFFADDGTWLFTVEDSDVKRPHIDRIVTCVNALAGISDPAAELERLRRIEESHAELLGWVRSTEAVRKKLNGPPSTVLSVLISRAEAARK